MGFWCYSSVGALTSKLEEFIQKFKNGKNTKMSYIRKILSAKGKVRPSIGLFIITKAPGEKGQLIVMLRRRGLVKFKSNYWRYEPYAGAHVASAHGKTRWEETPKETLCRKTKEQLGDFFCNIARLDDRQIHLLSKDIDRKAKTYGVCVHHNCIQYLFSDSSCAGFIPFPLSKIHTIRELTTADRGKVITDLNDIAMFADEIRALKAIRRNRQLLSYFNYHQRHHY